ncbi:hypothetical protein BD413DRAFT_44811 [Trametes elegans]|nr:hypothetical protein BD413DRAFT_44811 [Trametes elegans]
MTTTQSTLKHNAAHNPKQISEHIYAAFLNKASLSDLPITPRSKFALDGIFNDAHIKHRGASNEQVGRALLSQEVDTSFIDKLWNDPANKEFVDGFMYNKLCRDAAKGDETALEAYKHYAIQDYFYLIDYVKFKALRLATVPSTDLSTLESETPSVGRSYEWVVDWLQTCTEDLGIDPDVIATTERAIAELAYSNFLQNNTRTEDWFDLHVIVIPCVFGWSKLALELYNDPTTKKGTTFYNTWIVPNIAFSPQGQPQLGSSAVTLANFLAANADEWTSKIDLDENFNTLFRTAARLETALFNSGYEGSGHALPPV